jgi:hypothetical protein
MIKEVAIVANVGATNFNEELAKNLKQHQRMNPEIHYQMSTLPNGSIQYSALILYR